jgi:UDP:flavonoid glycosyltransferase YjiC (YdhE family)
MRILATSTPGIGHLNVLIPLMRSARDSGHDVLFVTAPESCELVSQLRFAVKPGGMASADRRKALESRMPEILAVPPRRRRGLVFAGFFAEAAAPVMRTDLSPVFDEFRPDLVVHEAGELAAGPMAVSRGIPHVNVAFSGCLPGWSEQVVTDSLTPLWIAEGLPAPSIEDLYGDLYLHPFPPSFDQAPTAGVVRPMRVESVEQESQVAPPWLDDLGQGRPLIYLTAGTEPAAAMTPWAASIEALANFDADVVATIGNHVDPASLGAVPPNVHVERFVPQGFVLDRATLAISHAGAGSLLGAAGRGVPQLLRPFAADQWENADAATGAGVAITCEMDRRSAADIGEAIDRLLNDPQYAQAAQRIAAEIAAMPSAADHVATLEAVCSGAL